MQKSDPNLTRISCALYFGIVGGLLAWMVDAGIMWEVIAGLAGAALGCVIAVLGDQASMQGGAYRARLTIWVVGCALLGTIFAIWGSGPLKPTSVLAGLVAGALAGLVFGGISNTMTFGVRRVLAPSLERTLGPIGAMVVLGGLSVGLLATVLWRRWSPGYGSPIMAGGIAGLIGAIGIATLAWGGSDRSDKKSSSNYLE
jgi:hypothetical protein